MGHAGEGSRQRAFKRRISTVKGNKKREERPKGEKGEQEEWRERGSDRTREGRRRRRRRVITEGSGRAAVEVPPREARKGTEDKRREPVKKRRDFPGTMTYSEQVTSCMSSDMGAPIGMGLTVLGREMGMG